MAEIDIIIAGRPYRVACRDGEEETLRAAARLVDAKSREALDGLGTLSEARQLLFAGLLLADQLVDQRPERRGDLAFAQLDRPRRRPHPDLEVVAERVRRPGRGRCGRRVGVEVRAGERGQDGAGLARVEVGRVDRRLGHEAGDTAGAPQPDPRVRDLHARIIASA